MTVVDEIVHNELEKLRKTIEQARQHLNKAYDLLDTCDTIVEFLHSLNSKSPEAEPNDC
jgi:uncharacterized protein YjaG (DUF416 family)